MPRVTRLRIFPIKGCSGALPGRVEIGPEGVVGDRRWMLVDETGNFLTQRKVPRLATFQATPLAEGVRVAIGTDVVELPAPSDGPSSNVQVWGDEVTARVSDRGSEWFSARLSRPVKLVWMPKPARPVGADGANPDDVVAFHDGYPALIISEASLADLNTRLDEPVPMDRFRPTVVVDGLAAYGEDDADELVTGSIRWQAAKRCGRCVVTTVDQTTGQKCGPEPLRTLAAYRRFDGEACFGMYFVSRTTGALEVGDPVHVVRAR